MLNAMVKARLKVERVGPVRQENCEIHVAHRPNTTVHPGSEEVDQLHVRDLVREGRKLLSIRRSPCHHSLIDHSLMIYRNPPSVDSSCAIGPGYSVYRWVMGSRRSLPNARTVIRTPGGAWRRLYSARSTIRTTRETVASSTSSAATISSGERSSTT